MQLCYKVFFLSSCFWLRYCGTFQDGCLDGKIGGVPAGFLDDDDEDEANMEMALDQLQDIMDASPPLRVVAGGSCKGKRANIERARVLMDERMYLDYFAETPVWGPSFFRHCYRMRRSLFLTILDRFVREIVIFCKKKMLVA